jgi:putative Mg2+ transporter-C (MgtC) family protein
VPIDNLDVLARVGTAFGLSYVLGFERQLRGSVAGDRTFALVGTSAAAITAVAAGSSPQAIAGVVTGIGFIGAGVVFKGRTGPHGITTAATILAAAAIGIVAGYGYLLVGLAVAAATLLVLEIPSLPILRFLDARTFEDLLRRDPDAQAAAADLPADPEPDRRPGPPPGPETDRGEAES